MGTPFQIYLELRYIGIYIGGMRHAYEHTHQHSHGHGRRRYARDGSDADHGERHRGGHHERRHGRHHRGRGERPFDYGELRLLLLAMTAEQPRHGYELMKAIEERTGGSYSPSPGVIYPTLAWLEDSGFATVEAEAGGRKRYLVTDAGRSLLEANRDTVGMLLARIGPASGQSGDIAATLHAPVREGMDSLKHALRERMRRSPFDESSAAAIAAALAAAAAAVAES
jgi:DNA-binding PadR family transcriptional regulator